MAIDEEKKSFILYCDMIHTIELLPDETAGKFLKHLLRYVNDKKPEASDALVKIAFAPIEQQLKRDLEIWRKKKKKNTENGQLGGIKSGESRRNKAN